jgi:hypothetical protein
MAVEREEIRAVDVETRGAADAAPGLQGAGGGAAVATLVSGGVA